jgi:hypothetical protein
MPTSPQIIAGLFSKTFLHASWVSLVSSRITWDTSGHLQMIDCQNLFNLHGVYAQKVLLSENAPAPWFVA